MISISLNLKKEHNENIEYIKLWIIQVYRPFQQSSWTPAIPFIIPIETKLWVSMTLYTYIV